MKILLWLTSALFSLGSYAQSDLHQEIPQAHGFHAPHHLSVFIGDTHIDGEGNNATIGLDYEHRLNTLLGIGTVLERAAGEIDAFTALLVTDIHFDNGLIMQMGPGYESGENEDVFVGRIGALYEFEFGAFTFSPQLHWDYHAEGENAIVAGIALGFSF